MFRANLDHTGVSSAPGVRKFSGVKWKFQSNGRVISSPAVESGLVYVGSTDKNFYAVDQQTGDDMVIAVGKLLSVGSILSSPVVVKDVIDVGSTDGNLYALD